MTTSDDENDNNALATPSDISLREAVIQGADGAVILFHPSLNGETINLDRGQLAMNSLTIDASNLPNGLTIDANQQSRVVQIEADAIVSLRGLTLTGGQTSGPADGSANVDVGGGIFTRARSALTLTACTVSGNRTGNGGSRVSFSRNGGNGGGIFAGFNSSLTLIGCTVSGNQTGNGGDNSGFDGSGDGGRGGGIFADESSSLTLFDCTVSGNQTGDGGDNSNSRARRIGAGGDGGGIIAFNAQTLTLFACTISGNQTGQGGIDTSGGDNNGLQGQSGGLAFFTSTNVTIGQSIIAGNTGRNGDFGPGNINTDQGNNLIGGEPQLAPLGHYGGPTQTMHPLAGSPAILDTAETTRTDQRGFDLTGPPTIGAVKLGSVRVVNNEDTLRNALTTEGDIEGQIIRFSLGLSSSITLSGTQLIVPGGANGLFIDASNLPNGLTIDANQQSRVMEIKPGATVALHGLTLTGGSTPLENGGAILNDNATLSLSACTLSANSAFSGGGIHSDDRGSGSARVSLSACTLSGNSASASGGGIFSRADNGSTTVSLSACTLFGNSATCFGGGIYSQSQSGEGTAKLRLKACTLSGNSAEEDGGGIYSESSFGGSATLSLNNSILAGNRLDSPVGMGSDLREFGDGATTTATGNNLMSGLVGQDSLNDADVILTDDPKLALLGDYGGPTQTMHPLAGSPAIRSEGDITRTDQRGFSLTGPPTIGAVKLGPVVEVTSEATLRNALAASAGTEGRVIRFGTVPGDTITLGNDGQLVVPSTADGLFMDASDLPDGLTIDADQRSRVMLIEENATAALHSLTLTGGRTSDSAGFAGFGGGIFAATSSSLTLTACTVSGNQTGNGGGSSLGGGFGGGILASSNSTLTLTTCTVSGNQTGDGGDIGGRGGFGGGIFAVGTSTLTLTTCTVSGNQTGDGGSSGIFGGNGGDGGDGGGIFVDLNGTLTLTACTISGNQTGQGGLDTSGGSNGEQGQSGGVGVFNFADLTIGQSIIAGNTGSSDDFGGGNIGTDLGDNLIGGDPKLAPLGDYGGPTQTMIPLPGSQAIDAASTSTRSTDQRGFPITDGSPDIGAVEFQGDSDIQLAIPNIFDIDTDGDGTPVGVELAIGTDPFVSDPENIANLRLVGFTDDDEPIFNFGLVEAQQDNLILRLVRSTDLIEFTPIFTSTDGFEFIFEGVPILRFDDTAAPEGKAFYRLEAERRPQNPSP